MSAWSLSGDSQVLPVMAGASSGGDSTETILSVIAGQLGYITDQDSEGVLEGNLAMSSVHRTHAPFGGESIAASKKARNCTCCVRLRLEGKFVMGSVHPNHVCAPSAIEMISSGIFCHPWSESIADPEEAEWASSGVECLVSDCNCCVGIVLTYGKSIADRRCR